MATANFNGRAQDQTGPSAAFFPVTPHDTESLPKGICRSLFVGTAGVVQVRNLAGDVVAFQSQASQYHPVRVRQVLATGTTATGIVALY